MNALKNFVKFQQLSRNVSTSQLRNRDLTRIKELQKKFQVDDGVPVYLKRGASDRVLFATLVVSLVGVLGYSAVTVKRIIFPPPNA